MSRVEDDLRQFLHRGLLIIAFDIFNLNKTLDLTERSYLTPADFLEFNNVSPTLWFEAYLSFCIDFVKDATGLRSAEDKPPKIYGAPLWNMTRPVVVTPRLLCLYLMSKQTVKSEKMLRFLTMDVATCLRPFGKVEFHRIFGAVIRLMIPGSDDLKVPLTYEFASDGKIGMRNGPSTYTMRCVDTLKKYWNGKTMKSAFCQGPCCRCFPTPQHFMHKEVCYECRLEYPAEDHNRDLEDDPWFNYSDDISSAASLGSVRATPPAQNYSPIPVL